MNETEELKSDDVFTKIALDNKLVTKFQIKKAAEERDRLAEEGKKTSLGKALVKLGFLTDKQLQSVEIARRYRVQRTQDKRIARQVLRMSLLDKKKVDEVLEAQKAEYSKGGDAKPLADILVKKKLLTSAQLAEVRRAIELRDAQGSGTKKFTKTAGGGLRAKGDEDELDDDDEGVPKLHVLEELPSGQEEAPRADDEDMVPEDELEELDDDDLRDMMEQDDDDDPAPAAKKVEEEDADAEPDRASDDERELATELAALPDGSDVALDKDEAKALEEKEEEDEDGPQGGWAADAFDEKPKDEKLKDEKPKDEKPKDEKQKAPPTKPPSPPPPPVKGGAQLAGGTTKPAAPAATSKPAVTSKPAIAAPASSKPASLEAAAKAGPASPAGATPGKATPRASVSPPAKPAPSAAAPVEARDALAIPGGELVGAFDSSEDGPPGAEEAAAIPGSELLDDVAAVPKGQVHDPGVPVERLSWRAEPSSMEQPRPLSVDTPKAESPASPASSTASATRPPSVLPQRLIKPLSSRTSETTAAPAPAPASAPAPRETPKPLDEAKLRRAFDRAVETAWKTFLEELKREG